MKMQPEHLEVLRKAIQPLDTDLRRNQYRRGDFPHSARVRDLSKRYRWDLLHASRLKLGDGKGMSGLPVYGYLDDTHIDTALRSIVPDITKPAPVVEKAC